MPDTNAGMLPGWLFSMVSNLGVYFILMLLGYAALTQIRKKPPASGDSSTYARLARFWVFGPDQAPAEAAEAGASSGEAAPAPKELSLGLKALQLMFCVCGLLGAYLSWGLLQEKIITTDYANGGRFDSSNFLVFCNRALALSVALVVTTVWPPPELKAPFYMFSFTSLSNVMSSWCQLESLKYVTFPTQVLAKSSKLIPVMLMGKVISKKKYKWWEYAVAVTIGGGVALFMIAQKGDSKKGAETTSVSGLFLLLGYLIFDSFTSQWQGHLFSTFKMSSYQMMLGINTFSGTFTVVSLLQSGELWQSLDFVLSNADCMVDILCFSVAGAVGQMFIFYTIKTFGPVVFTMVMTVRQLVAIVLSCIIYGHSISPQGLVGAAVVFCAIGYNIYRKKLAADERKRAKAAESRRVNQRGSEEAVELLAGAKSSEGDSSSGGGCGGDGGGAAAAAAVRPVEYKD